MLIQSATQIDHALYTGPFDVITPVGGSDPRRGGTPGKLPAHFESVIVSIGRPEWWNVRQLSVHQGVESDALLRELLRRHDVFLVRFACSLVPKEAEMIASAHFVVTTESEGSDGSTVAHDLLPMNVVNEEKSSVSFKGRMIHPNLAAPKPKATISGSKETNSTVVDTSPSPSSIFFSNFKLEAAGRPIFLRAPEVSHRRDEGADLDEAVRGRENLAWPLSIQDIRRQERCAHSCNRQILNSHPAVHLRSGTVGAPDPVTSEAAAPAETRCVPKRFGAKGPVDPDR